MLETGAGADTESTSILALPREIVEDIACLAGHTIPPSGHNRMRFYLDRGGIKYIRPVPSAWLLYASCKAFLWMRSLRYLVASGCFRSTALLAVRSADINGTLEGPKYTFALNASEPEFREYEYYEGGARLGASNHVASEKYCTSNGLGASGRFAQIRVIHGGEYCDPEDCERERSPFEVEAACECKMCVLLRATGRVLREHDPAAFEAARHLRAGWIPRLALLSCEVRNGPAELPQPVGLERRTGR